MATKKEKIKFRNRIILAIASGLTIYVLFFNNALTFLLEVGVDKTDELRIGIGMLGLIFSFAWVGVKAYREEI